MVAKKNITGMIFSRLTVIEELFTKSEGHTRWKCICDCGSLVSARGSHLRSGQVKSCGCLVKETTSRIGKALKTHGMTNAPEYAIWSAMKQRCGNEKDPSYADYGGRGIRVWSEWLMSFETFYAHMGPRPTPTHSLDRIEVDGHYDVFNCRWATPDEQQNNKRNSVKFEHEGQMLTVAQIARLTGISAGTLSTRLGRGMSINEATTVNGSSSLEA